MDHVDGTGKNENVKCFLDKKKTESSATSSMKAKKNTFSF